MLFGHDDASIAYDPLSANRRFPGAADLAGVGDSRVRRTHLPFHLSDGSGLFDATGGQHGSS